jgi:hypothetical protein
MGPRASLDTVEKRKMFAPAGNRTPARPTRNYINMPTAYCHCVNIVRTAYGGVETKAIPKQFVQIRDDVTAPDDDVHANSNVESLFTEIPIADTTNIIRQHLASYDL